MDNAHSVGIKKDWTWRIRFGVAAALLILSVIGLGVTDVVTRDAKWYWGIVIPVFMLATVRVWEHRADPTVHRNQWATLGSQALHWIGFLLAVQLVFLLERTGTIERIDAGLVSLVLLALSTYLAGLRFDRLLLVVALFQALLVIAAAYALEYIIWVVVAMLAVICGLYFLRRRPASAAALEGAR